MFKWISNRASAINLSGKILSRFGYHYDDLSEVQQQVFMGTILNLKEKGFENIEIINIFRDSIKKHGSLTNSLDSTIGMLSGLTQNIENTNIDTAVEDREEPTFEEIIEYDKSMDDNILHIISSFLKYCDVPPRSAKEISQDMWSKFKDRARIDFKNIQYHESQSVANLFSEELLVVFEMFVTRSEGQLLSYEDIITFKENKKYLIKGISFCLMNHEKFYGSIQIKPKNIATPLNTPSSYHSSNINIPPSQDYTNEYRSFVEKLTHYLLKYDPNFFSGTNERFSDGDTPLIRAARNNELDLVYNFLAKGADPTIKNKDGLTADRVARRAKHGNLAQLLVYAKDWWKKEGYKRV